MVITVSEPLIEVDASSQDISVVGTETPTVNVTITATPIEVTVSEAGPQGPAGKPGSSGAFYDATNKQGSTLAAGAPVATHSSGVGVVSASAADDMLEAVGLVTTSAVLLASANIQTDGPFELSDWTEVTGSVSLSPKAVYFLSTADGTLTTTPPSSFGNVMQKVGYAVGPQTLQISIEPSILL